MMFIRKIIILSTKLDTRITTIKRKIANIRFSSNKMVVTDTGSIITNTLRYTRVTITLNPPPKSTNINAHMKVASYIITKTMLLPTKMQPLLLCPSWNFKSQKTSIMSILKMSSVNMCVPTKRPRAMLTDLDTPLSSLVQANIPDKYITSKKEMKLSKCLMEEAAGKP